MLSNWNIFRLSAGGLLFLFFVVIIILAATGVIGGSGSTDKTHGFKINEKPV